MKHYFKFFIYVVLVCLFFSGCSLFTTNDNNINNIFTPISDDISMTPRKITGNVDESTIDVSKNVSPAVVGITSSTNYSYSVGSGVAVAKGGYVLTNSHVIINPNSIKLYLANGTSISASYVWSDTSLDMAIVKGAVDLPYLEIAPSDEPSVGEDVIAIGTPLQLQFQHSVTKGIVSALNRTVQVENDGGGSSLQSLIQHDASINPGNSGGPLINSKSQVVGINTLKIESAEGMGFAIPAIVIDNVLKNVLKDGTYESAYLGVFGYDSSIPYYYNKSASPVGMYLIDVEESSPAKLAGLKKGDIILSINNKKIKTALDFKRELFSYHENEIISIKYLQDEKEKTTEVTLVKRPNLFKKILLEETK